MILLLNTSQVDSIYQDTVVSVDPMDTQIIANNMFKDPMFVDSNSYELQYGSPCINAGHPLIVDVDGSRSDIGALGGPAGSFYIYQDLPPQTPKNFTGNAGTTAVFLSWTTNTESDLYYYILFRSESAGVPADSVHVRAYLTATDSEAVTFIDSTVIPQRSYFYALVAVDSSLLASSAAPEVQLLATDVDDHSVQLPIQFDLQQNYPNPFNTATAIVYNLPPIGAQPASIQLIIYNTLGQTVRVLVDEKQFPGRHIAYWDGNDEAGSPVSSGVYLYRLEVMGIDYARNKKMVLVK